MPTSWPIRWDLRTSKTHPLIINWIQHETFAGQIGITLCPGKYQPVSWSGGWNRNLQDDVLAIYNAGVSTVVSLVEDREMQTLRVPELGKAIFEHGMNWIHLPFRDTTAPDKKWLQHYETVQDRLIQSIQYGERIVVHCKGGLERAGMFTALLLINLGLGVETAINLVRKSRGPDCINPQQENFLRSIT